MIPLLLRCYPARWRARYGNEFATILAERRLGALGVADVLLGALDAWLHLRNVGHAGDLVASPPLSIRVGGCAAIVGGLLWPLAFLASAATPETGVTGLVLMSLATVLLLAALTGLGASWAGRHSMLAWPALLVPAMGAVVSIVGVLAMVAIGDRPIVGDLGPWSVWMLGTTGLIGGSGLFAVATWHVDALPRAVARHVDALPRAGASTLIVAAATLIPLMVGIVGAILPDAVEKVLSVVAMFAFASGWVMVGLGTIRRHGTAATAH